MLEFADIGRKLLNGEPRPNVGGLVLHGKLKTWLGEFGFPIDLDRERRIDVKKSGVARPVKLSPDWGSAVAKR